MIEKLSLELPPSRMFQPITSDYHNNLTFVEFLLGVLKKLNEVIVETNANAEYIKDFDQKYQELLAAFNALEAEFNALRDEFDGLKDDILDAVSAKLTEFYQQVQDQISIAVNYLKAYSDANDAIINNRIDQIVLGNIELIDPTTGVLTPLQDVINNIAGTGRDALTATEYDALELTATTYDGYEITAYDYDYHSKAILTA